MVGQLGPSLLAELLQLLGWDVRSQSFGLKLFFAPKTTVLELTYYSQSSYVQLEIAQGHNLLGETRLRSHHLRSGLIACAAQ